MVCMNSVSKWYTNAQSTHFATRVNATLFAFEEDLADIKETEFFAYTLGGVYQLTLILKDMKNFNFLGRALKRKVEELLDTYMNDTYLMRNLGLPRISWFSEEKDSSEYLNQFCHDPETSKWIYSGRFLDPADTKSYVDWLLAAEETTQQRSIFAFSVGRMLAKMEFDLDLGRSQDKLTDGQLTWLVVLSREITEKERFLKEIDSFRKREKEKYGVTEHLGLHHLPSYAFLEREADSFFKVKDSMVKKIVKKEAKKESLKIQKSLCESGEE